MESSAGVIASNLWTRKRPRRESGKPYHPPTHKHTHTHPFTHSLTHTHTHTHTLTHTLTHSPAHTHTPTHPHTHPQLPEILENKAHAATDVPVYFYGSHDYSWIPFHHVTSYRADILTPTSKDCGKNEKLK